MVRPPEIFDLAFLEKLRAFHRDLEREVPYLERVTSMINARSTRGEGDELIVEDLLARWPENQEDLEALQEELQRAAEEAAQQEQQMAQQQLTPEELEALRREQEQQQAMEQWLRRIPNDPGGLLRRKFRYQYQKTGKDQDGNNTWPDDEVQPW